MVPVSRGIGMHRRFSRSQHEVIGMSNLSYALEINYPVSCCLKGEFDATCVALNDNVITQKLDQQFNHYTIGLISSPLGYERFQCGGSNAVVSMRWFQCGGSNAVVALGRSATEVGLHSGYRHAYQLKEVNCSGTLHHLNPSWASR
jgi:hypothetical protein